MKLENLVIVEMEEDCIACPTIYNYRTDDDIELWSKYRWGYFSLRINEDKGLFDTELWGQQLTNAWNGVMSKEQTIELLEKQGIKFII